MGQSVGRGRWSSLLDDLDGGSLGVAEKVTGNRQAEEPLVSGRGQSGLLPCGKAAKLFEPALFQLEELPVVRVVDRLDSLFGPGRANNLGRGRPGFVLISVLPRSHRRQGQRGDCHQQHSHLASKTSPSHLDPFSRKRVCSYSSKRRLANVT